MNRQPVRIASYAVAGTGAALLALNLLLGGKLNIALPLVILILGVIFFILVFANRQKWSWASLLYIPGSLLIALGLILLFNILTNDLSAWAYAWLLLTAGLGVGLVLANRERLWHRFVTPIGWGLAIGSVTLFVLFGALAGGLFIQVMAPVLLILGGLSLRWLPLETLLPEHLLIRFGLRPDLGAGSQASLAPAGLVEPLSAREIEVLRLVEQGFSNQQIATQLNIASSTVKTHINNIYGKLEVQSRVQAIRRARDLGLLDS